MRRVALALLLACGDSSPSGAGATPSSTPPTGVVPPGTLPPGTTPPETLPAEPPPINADPNGVTAIRADAFLDSIGACTHVGQGIDDPAKSATALKFAGIRNIRDDGRPEHVDDWIAMHDAAGIKIDILANHVIADTIDMAKKLAAKGALLAVEGANEPNNFSVTYGGATSDYNGSFLPVAKLQKDLYAAVHGEPALAGIPVYHSSEAGGSEPDNVGLQYLTIPDDANIAMPNGTKYADFANTHNYVCGHAQVLLDNISWKASDPLLNGDWDGMKVEYGKTWHKNFAGYSDADLEKLPRVTTETGWVTSGTGAITQDQQGKVLTNLYLAAFKRGWANTFVYMLRDDPGQGIWGFFANDYTPKKSGTYLHNLTTFLADTKSENAPSKLDYAIGSPPETTHDLLLEKKDGTFELVVWSERLTGGTDDVVVDLKRSRAKVTIYDVVTEEKTTKENVTSVTVTLGDHPVVIEL